MNSSRAKLENQIHEAIRQVKTSRKSMLNINKTLSSMKVALGTFEEISRGARALSGLDLPLLWALSAALYQETHHSALEPKVWFTSREISDFEFALLEESEVPAQMKLPIQFSSVLAVDPETYITQVTMSLLVEMYRAQLIKYEFNARGSTKDRRGIPMLNVDKQSLEDMSLHMVNGTYFPDMMTINVTSGESAAVSYDSETQKLSIMEGAEITLLDGLQRLQAGVKAVALQPELEQKMMLSIRCYSPEKARKFIEQISLLGMAKEDKRKRRKAKPHGADIEREGSVHNDK